MSTEARDIVIVGGGPAGLTTAIALTKLVPAARARTVVLEAEKYPRDKYCAGALGGRGDRILERLGARPDVPGEPIHGISLRTTGGKTAARVADIGRVIRRIEFDAELARLAQASGVRVDEEARVERIEERNDGAIVETTRRAYAAKIVVGADGVGSVVRRTMGLSKGRFRAQVLEVDTEPTPHDPDRAFIHFDASDRELSGYTWDFPTVVDGRHLVCRGIYHLRLGDEVVDIRARFAARLAAMGFELEALKNKRFAERGFEPEGTIAKGSLMLVGEAAGIDPITGEGIAQAIEHGELAGRFLASALDRGALSVLGWGDAVRASRLARDLRFRARAVTASYGRFRPRIEQLVLGCPSALHLCCQHFAALPLDRARLVHLALCAGWELLAGRLR